VFFSPIFGLLVTDQESAKHIAVFAKWDACKSSGLSQQINGFCYSHCCV